MYSGQSRPWPEPRARHGGAACRGPRAGAAGSGIFFLTLSLPLTAASGPRRRRRGPL